MGVSKKFHGGFIVAGIVDAARRNMPSAHMRIPILIAALATCAGCNLIDQKNNKPGVCIHSTTITTKTGSCAGTQASQRIATYCTDENNESDCKNNSVGCASTTLTEHDDTIIFYADKKCDSSGYTLSCPNNSNYKVADSTTFCP